MLAVCTSKTIGSCTLIILRRVCSVWQDFHPDFHSVPCAQPRVKTNALYGYTPKDGESNGKKMKNEMEATIHKTGGKLPELELLSTPGRLNPHKRVRIARAKLRGKLERG